jgi:hypothetical protein
MPGVPTVEGQAVPSLPDLPVAIGPASLPPEPEPEPEPEEQPDLPPQPDVARGIEVSGVVQVGNEVQVIAKAPSEPFSRYVKVGQRMAGGRVLVKRVEMKQGAEPVVILEEKGIEVAIEVGENVQTSKEEQD